MIRPGLQDLLPAATSGKFDIVVAEALDRLSRDQADVATIYKRLTFAGVTIFTLAEGEINELHVGLKGTMNQLFLKDLAEKTRRGLRGRVEAGMSGGGNSAVRRTRTSLRYPYPTYRSGSEKAAPFGESGGAGLLAGVVVLEVALSWKVVVDRGMD